MRTPVESAGTRSVEKDSARGGYLIVVGSGLSVDLLDGQFQVGGKPRVGLRPHGLAGVNCGRDADRQRTETAIK